MNNIFNIKRFGLVLSKDFQEKWKKYMLQFLMMFGLMAVLSIWFIYNSKGDNPQVYSPLDNFQLLQFASLMFLGFGIVFAATLMEPMREKTSRIAYLTIPASHFEKFFSRWLIVTIGYIVAFCIALWLADIVRVAFLSYRFPELGIRFLDFRMLVNPEKANNYNEYVFFHKEFFMFCIGFYLLLQSFFVLGATFWEKLSFVKTFTVISAIGLLYIYLNWWMIQHVFKEPSDFSNVLFVLLGQPSQNATLHLITCISVFFSLVFWALAYFRFRESEIIKRL